METGIELVIPKELQHAGGLSSKLLSALRANSPEIAETIRLRIRERTERLTGALREAETAESYTASSASDGPVTLARWYADDAPQLEEYGRVYVAYQEGAPLGLPTYTNEGHQMYGSVETEDLDLIEAWAHDTIGRTLDRLLGTSP